MVTPRSRRSASSRLHIRSRCSGSRPTVGSSRMSSSGRCTVARAMSVSRRQPPESCRAGREAWAPGRCLRQRRVDRCAGPRARQAPSVPRRTKVFARRQQAVDARVLKDEPSRRRIGRALATTIVSEDMCDAARKGAAASPAAASPSSCRRRSDRGCRPGRRARPVIERVERAARSVIASEPRWLRWPTPQRSSGEGARCDKASHVRPHPIEGLHVRDDSSKRYR